MSMLPALGLRARIVIYLALVMAVFIVLTELSVSELVRMAMSKQSETGTMESILPNLRKLILFYMIFGAAIALLLGSFAITRLIVRPLGQVTRAVEQVSEGMLETNVPIKGTGEITRLGIAFNRMTSTLRTQRSELKSQLAELEESSTNLRKVQDKLIRAAKLASVGTLAAGVAHEIGNPIAGVLGLLDAMEYEKEETATKRYRKLMKDEVERIDRIINDLLVYARPSGSTEDRPSGPECTDIKEVFEHVTALLGAQKLFDKVNIEPGFSTTAVTVALAKDDLTQIFVNLLLNAAQAMNGSGDIKIETEVVDNWRGGLGGVERKAVKVIFSDNGPGIPKEDAGQIFDPFFSKRDTGTGSGLGLAICMAICERSGGEIALDADYSEGTRFILTLLAA